MAGGPYVAMCDGSCLVRRVRLRRVRLLDGTNTDAGDRRDERRGSRCWPKAGHEKEAGEASGGSACRLARRGLGEGAWQRVHVLVLHSLLVLLVHSSTAPSLCFLARASLPPRSTSLPAPKMLHRKRCTENADADVNSQIPG